jgi:alpha-tubulin suppressor-like RCC1 family protein
VEEGEVCDGDRLNDHSCQTEGFDGGEIVCVACALDTSGCTRCGDGTCSEHEIATGCPEDCGVVKVEGGGVSEQGGTTCAVLASGEARCWGYGGDGQRGDGSLVQEAREPRAVLGLGDATQITSGYHVTCAVTGSGAAWCWGAGELGDGNNENSSTPVQVSGLAAATAVASAYWHVCAVDSGLVYCWGYQANPYLIGEGVPVSTTVFEPRLVPGIAGATGLSATLAHTCARLDTGRVVCWGRNESGELGGGFTSESAGPTEALGVEDAVAVTAGISFSCALTGAGDVYCWGYGNLVGDGNPDPHPTPVLVAGLPAVVSLAAGSSHVCAATDGGDVYCWGWNANGQAGYGGDKLLPERHPGVSGAISMGAGFAHTCAILDDLTLRCWGSNGDGELGDGNLAGGPDPVEPIGL